MINDLMDRALRYGPYSTHASLNEAMVAVLAEQNAALRAEIGKLQTQVTENTARIVLLERANNG